MLRSLLKRSLVASSACLALPLAIASFDGEKVSTARHAICVLYPTDASEVYGIVSFSQEDMTTPTKVVAGIRGLNPNSNFGLQLLEYGDLTEGSASLGKSFSTPGASSPASATPTFYRHSGDLGNVMSDENGAAYNAFTNPYIKLFGENNIYGRSCGVYSETNDPITSLNNGSLLSAGVIGKSRTFKNLPPA